MTSKKIFCFCVKRIQPAVQVCRANFIEDHPMESLNAFRVRN
jgi:hypothetical protein